MVNIKSPLRVKTLNTLHILDGLYDHIPEEMDKEKKATNYAILHLGPKNPEDSSGDSDGSDEPESNSDIS